ncbi:MAG: tyrosine-type recombinase/integrase [Candidatus Thorarchaeota archaeon]
MKREKTKYIGVFKRASQHRVFKNKPDICFEILYKINGKLAREKIGWLSEGYSAQIAATVRGERIRAIRHGLELPQDKKKIPLFKDVTSKYLDWASINKTRHGYDEKNRYTKHLKIFDNKRLDEISSFSLEKLKKKMHNKKLAPATIKHVLVLFREIFNKALQWWNIDIKNPVKNVKMPNTSNNYRLRFFSREEICLLLKELKAYSQLHDMSLISLRTGARFKEITGIKGGDIDLNNNTIAILDSKNGEIAHVHMTSDLKNMFQKYNLIKSDYIFKNKHGKRIKEISDTFSRVIKRLGFNDGITDRRKILTFHSLRHTFASWLALQGEDIKTIQELMRHKTIIMTMKYAHLIQSHKNKAVEKLTQNNE